jgi:hypothetical protein
MRCLTCRYRVRSLLKLNDLFVHEAGTVVYNLHRVLRLADRTRAFGRFGDLPAVNIHLNRMIADLASEEGVLHVGNDRTGTNNETFDGNNFVDI